MSNKKLPTPNYKLNDPSVYPPSEDSFLLLDGLEADQERIASVRPTLCVEVGCGSGIVSAFLHKMIDSNCVENPEGQQQASTSSSSTSPAIVCLCTDLNIQALDCTQNTFQLNGLPSNSLQLVQCNLLDPLVGRLRNCVDILLMNPPYVPTEKSPQDKQELCYAGGLHGRALLDQLLPHVAGILAPGGLFYLVALKENDIDELISSATRDKYGIEGQIVMERQCRNEHLYVLRFARRDAGGATTTDIKCNVDGDCSQQEGPSKEISRPPSKPSLPAATTTTTPAKITIHLKPVGGAPQLAKEYTKLATKPTSTVAYIQQVLRKWINLKPTDSLFLFVNESFAPFPEHTIGNLYDCFGSRDSAKLYLQYSLTPAWG